MEALKRRLLFLRQSSLAPRNVDPPGLSVEESQRLMSEEQLDATLQLLFYASQGNVDGVEAMLKKETPVDSTDFDLRTALHVAACENKLEVVKFLLQKGAHVNVEDRWGSTPLADAQHYGNIEVCNVLEKHGGRLENSLMRTSSALVPEYEIDHSTLDFSVNQLPSRKGDLYRTALWQGTKVWVKLIPEITVGDDEELVGKFIDELSLLLKLRHPNVVQFLGAVTQTSPMMIVTEFLPGGDLRAFMDDRNGRFMDVRKAISFALDIARGLNYLHELKPYAIIHRDLKPSNLVLSEASTGHMKVANFGFSQSIQEESKVLDSVSARHQGSFCRYMAPEIFNRGAYDKSVDIFAFGLIMQEMLEGHHPFPAITEDIKVAQAYAQGKRPEFRHGGRLYPAFLKELIEECWNYYPEKRPVIGDVIRRLKQIKDNNSWKSKLKFLLSRQK